MEMETYYNNLIFKLKIEQQFGNFFTLESSGYWNQGKAFELKINKTDGKLKLDVFSPFWQKKLLELSWKIDDLQIFVKDNETEILFIAVKYNLDHWVGKLDTILSIDYFQIDKMEMSISYHLISNSKMIQVKFSNGIQERVSTLIEMLIILTFISLSNSSYCVIMKINVDKIFSSLREKYLPI